MSLPDDVTPTDAQERYDQYLADYWGSQVRAQDFKSGQLRGHAIAGWVEQWLAQDLPRKVTQWWYFQV